MVVFSSSLASESPPTAIQNSKLMGRLVLPNESPLQLIERPSGCRLLDKLAVDGVLIKFV